MEFETKRLRIRRMRLSDFSAVYQHRKNPATAKYIGPPATRESAMVRLQQACQEWHGKVDEKLILAIELKSSEQLIGELVFKFIQEDKQSGEIGFRLAAEQIGKGLGYEAVSGLIKSLFDNFPLQTIQAICAAQNSQSRRLLERLGMHCQHLQPEGLEIAGVKYDSLTYLIAK